MSVSDIILIILFVLILVMIFKPELIEKNFFRNNSSVRSNKMSKVSFKDVAGLYEAKKELEEIVAFFHNPKLFRRIGIKMPKGVLLVGPPGNGKTLLAKALAGECKIPFFSCSGSQFDEALVGLGALKIRKLFQEARECPRGCIIFIDEIDTIGYKRYSANISRNNEQTLNQLLHEMDGFESQKNVFVLGATNNLDVLDPALLRPGRFDRQIYISEPNLRNRRDIINLCLSSIFLLNTEELDVEEIAYLTKGLSAAQITNVFNEAAILCVRDKKQIMKLEVIFEAIDKVLLGPSIISHIISDTNLKKVAYHEAGHAIVGLFLPEILVKKITIIPHSFSLGYTWLETKDEDDYGNMINKKEILAQVMVSLGGRISEELFLKDEQVTAGAHDDFRKASKLIREMITEFGFSDLGIILEATKPNISFGTISANISQNMIQKIEETAKKILDQCLEKVKEILSRKKKTVELLVQFLLRKKCVYKPEINYIYINETDPELFLIS